jgi:hypothetical protein
MFRNCECPEKAAETQCGMDVKNKTPAAVAEPAGTIQSRANDRPQLRFGPNFPFLVPSLSKRFGRGAASITGRNASMEPPRTSSHAQSPRKNRPIWGGSAPRAHGRSRRRCSGAKPQSLWPAFWIADFSMSVSDLAISA